MIKGKKLLDFKVLLFFVLVSAPAVWALFVPGFYGASDDLHIAWLHQMKQALISGQVPPRFVPDLSFGFGYPLFNFVFPFPFYIGLIFNFLGFSLVDSIKVVFVLSVPLSGFLMYRLIRERAHMLLAISGGVVYMYSPYRATDIYVRGAIGESLAFVFYPLIVFGVLAVSKYGRQADIALASLGISMLILTHNIAAYMFMPFVLILIFFLGEKLKNIFAVFMGLLVSSYFWVPALLESKLVRQDTVFDYFDHFPAVVQLLRPFFGYGASVPGPYDGMSFFVGHVNLAVLFLGLLLGFMKLSSMEGKTRKMFFWIAGGVAISFFMMNHRSAVLWESVPYLGFFQFPWRFLGLIVFFSSVSFIFFDRNVHLRRLGVLLGVLAVALNFTYFRPQDFLGRRDEYYLNRYIPTPVASVEYLQTSEEYLRLPLATQMRPEMNHPLVEIESGELIKLSSANGLKANFEVFSENGTGVSYNKYYFPGWNVRVNGQKVEALAGEPFGQVYFELGSGTSEVDVEFGETVVRSVLNVISLLGFVYIAKMLLRRD